jgi:hypothetical protein
VKILEIDIKNVYPRKTKAKVVIQIVESLVEKENPFNFCNGYQNLQCSTT